MHGKRYVEMDRTHITKEYNYRPHLFIYLITFNALPSQLTCLDVSYCPPQLPAESGGTVRAMRTSPPLNTAVLRPHANC